MATVQGGACSDITDHKETRNTNLCKTAASISKAYIYLNKTVPKDNYLTYAEPDRHLHITL